ncbi:MAG: helix-turn-helix domain-containing protein, partial [Bacteroidales bacterium]|nr:helix-turn-helix domain-containing protein [Bacteroidales bacterium]
RHRIEKAKELILQAESLKYSLEGIAHLVGYRSKSSFIQHFREHTGVTPGQFKTHLHSNY